MILNVGSNVHDENVGQIYDVRMNEHLGIDEPNLYIVPTLHRELIFHSLYSNKLRGG